MNLAPKDALELRGGDDLARVRQQQLERGQLHGRQVNERFSAEEGTIGFQPQAGEQECRFCMPA